MQVDFRGKTSFEHIDAVSADISNLFIIEQIRIRANIRQSGEKTYDGTQMVRKIARV